MLNIHKVFKMVQDQIWKLEDERTVVMRSKLFVESKAKIKE